MNDCMGECMNAILLLESHPMAGRIVCQWVAVWGHPRILGHSWREGMASRLQTDIHTSMHTVIQRDKQTYILTHVHLYTQTLQQNRHFATCPRQASRQALRLWKWPSDAMKSAAKQTLCYRGKPRGRRRGYGNGHLCHGKWSKTDIFARMKQASRLWKAQQRRDLARMRQASRQASRLWKWRLMLWKVEQNRQASRQASRLWKVQQRRDLARMRQAPRQASRQALRQASRLWKLQQRRDLARMKQASRQASRLWKWRLMLWKVEQNRHFC